MLYPVHLLITLVFVALIVLLQIFLSKRESIWPGLILPILSFLFSVLFVLNMALPPEGVTGSFVWQTIVVFLLENIPTVILLAIHFACRGKMRRKKQLDKMNIQDLD